MTKTAYVGMLPFGLALVLSTVFVKNYRLYWFAIFLLSLQFTISKNLNDGLAVIDKLKIDYTIQNFVFEITATDLALLVLLAFWANDCLFHGKNMRFPPITWLAVGYLGISLLSLVGAESPYLGFVELSRQIKFFIVYLFAVNCLDSKSAVRVLAVVGVIILVTQAGMTVARFETGYMTPLTFGETYQDLSQIEQYLAVDRFDEGSAVRAFGTLGSPGSTLRLCMMVIPFALFLSVRNAMFGMRFAFATLTAFGLLGLVLTFTRVYYITTAIQIVLAFLIMIRDRMLSREEVAMIVLLGLAAVAAASPKLYEQFTVREESVTVRLQQYEAAAKMILDNPFLGVGLNNGTGQKPKYVDVTHNPYDPDTQFYLEPTHNIYLSLASEIGVLGALIFVAFFARVTLLAWRQSRHSTDPEIRLVANALVVVFCGVAVNGLMDPLQEYHVQVLLWLYAGIILNLPEMAQGQETVDPQARPLAFLLKSDPAAVGLPDGARAGSGVSGSNICWVDDAQIRSGSSFDGLMSGQ
ncbi:MAG: O-antigen ligase family protein [Methylocella sp.]